MAPSIRDVLDELGGGGRPAVGDVPGRANPDPRDAEDANYRRAYGVHGRRPFGRPLRAAFYAYLPDVPRTRNLPADFARDYLRRIRDVQEMQCWSRRERLRLRVLERRWERRAEGRDGRYNTLGTQPGPTNKYRAPAPQDRVEQLCAQLRGEMPPDTPQPFGTWRPR